MRFFFATATIIAILIGGSQSYANPQSLKTRYGYVFDLCWVYKSRGYSPIITWIPGIHAECYVSEAASDKDKRLALARCEKKMKRVRRRIAFKERCKLAYDGYKMSAGLKTAISKDVRIPVTVSIFDYSRNRPEVGKGIVYSLKSNNGAVAVALDYRGVTICRGRIFTYSILGFSHDFNLKCFGDLQYNGNARITKVRKDGMFYTLVPDQVKLSSGSNWIKIMF